MSFRYRMPKRAAARPAGPELPFGDGTPEAKAIPVSLFVAKLNGVLRASLPDAWVKGEIGEWRIWSSGHAYFSLKDASAALPAVMWASDVARVPFRPEEGMEVLARGRPDVYPRSGKLSFVVSEIQPVGAGALQLALEQLRARLAAEGLFDPARKKRLPLLPRRIGVVTSRHGAAVRDVLKVLSARFPNAHVTVWPVAVQGPAAPVEIARALDGFSRLGAADVVIVARGGGSRDDLSAFNDEKVVRAVAACRVPTISAVGHEIDVTLTDLAADLRAEAIPLDILYEDADILVINKPAGMIVHPGAGHKSGTVVNAALYRWPEMRQVGDPERPGVVHRLDKETSGVLILTRTQEAYTWLVRQF